jgi:hypothetical protein
MPEVLLALPVPSRLITTAGRVMIVIDAELMRWKGAHYISVCAVGSGLGKL